MQFTCDSGMDATWKIKNPMTDNYIDLEAASLTIDMIAMLKDKTREILVMRNLKY